MEHLLRYLHKTKQNKTAQVHKLFSLIIFPLFQNGSSWPFLFIMPTISLHLIFPSNRIYLSVKTAIHPFPFDLCKLKPDHSFQLYFGLDFSSITTKISQRFIPGNFYKDFYFIASLVNFSVWQLVFLALKCLRSFKHNSGGSSSRSSHRW